MATCTVTVNYRSALGDHVDIANFQVSALAVYLGNPIVTPDAVNFNVVDGGTFELEQGDRLRIRVTTWDAEWSVEVPAQTAIGLDELALNHSINPTSGLPAPIVPYSMQDLVTQTIAARDGAQGAKSDAETARDDVLAAKTDVEADVIAAESAKTGAEVARDEAIAVVAGTGVSLDTDGTPYVSSSGTTPIALDTDGVPYLVIA